MFTPRVWSRQEKRQISHTVWRSQYDEYLKFHLTHIFVFCWPKQFLLFKNFIGLINKEPSLNLNTKFLEHYYVNIWCFFFKLSLHEIMFLFLF